MKKIVFSICMLFASVNINANEPSKYAIGMLIFLDRYLGRADKVEMSDFIEFMKNDYNYTITQIFPHNLHTISIGFNFYKIQNDKWNGIIAVENDCGIYRLKGFYINDFSTFFSNYKYAASLVTKKRSDRKLLKTLEGFEVDCKCLYNAHKKLECTLKEKYPCANRSWDGCVIGGNCFK